MYRWNDQVPVYPVDGLSFWIQKIQTCISMDGRRLIAPKNRSIKELLHVASLANKDKEYVLARFNQSLLKEDGQAKNGGLSHNKES